MKRLYRIKRGAAFKGLIALLIIALAVINVKLSHRSKPGASKLNLETLQLKYRQYE